MPHDHGSHIYQPLQLMPVPPNWRIDARFRDNESGEEWTEPVIGFVIEEAADGLRNFTALTIDPCGGLEDPSENIGAFLELVSERNL